MVILSSNKSIKLLLFVILSFLASCSDDYVHSEEYSKRTFTVLEIKLLRVEDSVYDYKRNVPGERTFSFEACIVDNGFNKPVIDNSFIIEIDGASYKKKTKINGCLYWSTDIKFDYFDQHTFYRYNIKIDPTEKHTGSEQISGAINPWRKSQSAWVDLRYSSVPGKIVDLFDAEKGSGLSNRLVDDDCSEGSTLYFNEVVTSYLGKSFSFDSNLSVTMNRQYQVIITTEHVSFDMLSGYVSNDIFKLKEKFLLKIYWVPESTNNKNQEIEIVSHTQKVVTIDQGVIDETFDLELPFHDLAFLETRGWLYVSLVPVSGELNIKPAHIKFKFYPTKEEHVSRPILINSIPQELSELFSAKSKKHEEINMEELIKKFSRHYNLKKEKIGNIKYLKQNEFDYLHETIDKNNLEMLCNYFLKSSLRPLKYLKCKKNPFEYFDVKRVIFVNNVVGPVEARPGLPQKFSLNATFFVEGSHQEESIKGNARYRDVYGEGRVKASGGFDFFGNSIKAEVMGGYRSGHKWYRAFNIFNVTNYRNRFSFFEISEFVVEEIELSFWANVKKCMLINNKMNKKKQPLIVCDDKKTLQKERVTESWYYVTPNKNYVANVFYDHASSNKHLLKKLIRGKKRFMVFKSIFENRDLKFLLKQEGPLMETKEIAKKSFSKYNLKSSLLIDTAFPQVIELD